MLRSAIRISRSFHGRQHVASATKGKQFWPVSSLARRYPIHQHFAQLEPSAIRLFSTHEEEQARLSEVPEDMEKNSALARMAPKDAESVLRKKEKKGKIPAISSYNTVLDLYVKDNKAGAAQKLLLTMKQKPTEISFSIVALAWIRRRQIRRAEELLWIFMQRNIATTWCFNVVISAHARNRSRKVIGLMHSMHNYAQNGHPEARPDKITCTNVLKIFVAHRQPKEADLLLQKMWKSRHPNMKPDAFTYSQVFEAYQRTRLPDNLERAEHVLKQMQEQYKQDGELSVKPTPYVLLAFLRVVANAKNGERAEEFVREMVNHNDPPPDILHHKTVLEAWRNAGNGIRAENYLWSIPSPSQECFAITIQALHHQEEPERAEALLNYMIQSDDEEMLPDPKTVAFVVRAWGKSNRPDAMENAERVLSKVEPEYRHILSPEVYRALFDSISASQSVTNKAEAVMNVWNRMVKQSVEPDIFTYKRAIEVIGETEGQVQSEALESAMKLYLALTPEQRAQRKVSSAMLEACAKLSPEGVNGGADFVKELFDFMCNEGIVVRSTDLKSFQQAATDELLKEVFDTTDRTKHLNQLKIPNKWTKNVREKRSESHGRRK